MSNFKNAVLLGIAFLALFAIAELLYHRTKVKAEYTRKFVHVITGLLTLLFPLLFDHHIWVLLLCAGFALILTVSLKMKWIPSINGIDRESVGSIAYPVAVYGCFMVFEHHQRDLLFFYVPILVLAICDPMAALFGQRWPIGRYRLSGGYKSLMGTSMFVASAFAVTILLVWCIPTSGGVSRWPMVVGVSVLCAFAEAVSPKGWDNITIPGTALLVMELSDR